MDDFLKYLTEYSRYWYRAVRVDIWSRIFFWMRMVLVLILWVSIPVRWEYSLSQRLRKKRNTSGISKEICWLGWGQPIKTTGFTALKKLNTVVIFNSSCPLTGCSHVIDQNSYQNLEIIGKKKRRKCFWVYLGSIILQNYNWTGLLLTGVIISRWLHTVSATLPIYSKFPTLHRDLHMAG